MDSINITGTAMGPEKWRSSILKNIRDNSLLIKRVDHSNNLAFSTDPLPHQRTVALELSNQEAMKHFRSVFLVVERLRRQFVATNEEVKIMMREKAQMQKILDEIMKDYSVNKDSQQIRSKRPDEIKQVNDGADDLLNAERVHLNNLKMEAEATLKAIQDRLQDLGDSRDYLGRVLRERERVLELHHYKSKSNQYAPSYLRRGQSNQLYRSATDLGVADDSSSTSHMIGFDSGHGRPAFTADGSVFSIVDPLGAYTPDCDAALKRAEDAIQDARHTRTNTAQSVQRIRRLLASVHNSVNEGLLRRIAETATVKQQLELAHADNRSAVNRANRCHDYTRNNLTQLTGARLTKYLTTSEKLDRPMMRVFQRHPGTQVPEAQHIVNDTHNLEESVQMTLQNMSALRLMDYKLQRDIHHNAQSMTVDLHALRMRRQKAGDFRRALY